MKHSKQKKTEIKGILFDVGGILVSTPGPASAELFARRLVKQYGVSAHNLESFLKKVVALWNLGKENPTLNFWRKLSKKLGIKGADVYKFNYFAMFDYKRSTRPHKKTLALVKKLGKRYKLGVLSNANRISTAVNKKRGLFRDFDVLLFSFEVKCVKPQKKIFQTAARKMKLPPQNLLFIDDKLENVKAARKFGMQAIQFRSFPQLKRDLKKLSII